MRVYLLSYRAGGRRVEVHLLAPDTQAAARIADGLVPLISSFSLRLWLRAAR